MLEELEELLLIEGHTLQLLWDDIIFSLKVAFFEDEFAKSLSIPVSSELVEGISI